MGDVKDNMKSGSCESAKKQETIMGKLLTRRRKSADNADSVETYADCIEKAEKKISELVVMKSAHLTSEKGSELSNTLKLGNLKLQQMHIDAIIDLMNDYVEIK
jgi:hypothetical protein